jgi:hypothetical protein
MSLFDQLARACADFLWIHQYPSETPATLHPNQFRDLVRTFMAGAVEGYMAMGMKEPVRDIVDEMKLMASPDWRPDARFYPQRPPTRLN